MKRSNLILAGLIATASLIPQAAQAQTAPVLDWEEIAQNEEWDSGQRSGTFDVGSGTVTVDFETGGDTRFVGFGGGSITPDINSVVNGSAGDDDRTMHMQIDSGSVNPAENFIKMTTSFNGFGGPLQGVSFNLYDIDISGGRSWHDRVMIKGFLGDQVVSPEFSFYDKITADYTADSSNIVSQLDAHTLQGNKSQIDNNKDDANVKVSFGGAIDRFELFFTDGFGTGKDNPSSHGISIGDIALGQPTQETPEPGSLLSLGGLAVAGLVSRRLQAKRLAQSS
ncbi:MAG: PEP-CTERM sorting domain-containing protein [Cyanobacteria bacterium P01_C01_bin.120]